ncbi:hypothetical protein GCM10010176_105150 [Nonomuraea spiralis]|nr:hypothetical protein GCM10010176_105150 [Nonomuraea spiralis]
MLDAGQSSGGERVAQEGGDAVAVGVGGAQVGILGHDKSVYAGSRYVASVLAERKLGAQRNQGRGVPRPDIKDRRRATGS